MNKFAKILISVAIVGGVAALAWVASRKGQTKATEVRIETVEARDLVASVTASGQIQPRTMVNVSADVSGKIVRLSVKEGDMVTKDQFLLQIDPEQPTAALQRAQAALASSRAQHAQARANLLQAERNYQRQQELKKTAANLVSDAELEQLRTQVEINQAQAEAANYGVEQAVASVRDAQQALSRTTITAPMSGRIVRLRVEEGETAIMGTLNRAEATLLTIADMSVLETKVRVDETEVARIGIGDSAVVQIDAFSDTTFVGRVVEISHSSVAGASSTGDRAIDYEVTIQLVDAPAETRPDFSATAKIITATRTQALSVPIIALTVRENTDLPNRDSAVAVGSSQPAVGVGKRDVEGVFVVDDANKVTFRPVKVGITGERHFEVLSGLKAGDKIVAGSYQAIRELKDGATVRAIQDTKPQTTEK